MYGRHWCFNAYLISCAPLEDAQAARIWLHGSLNGVSWPQVLPMVGWFAVCASLALLWAPKLKLLELGRVSAASLGLNPQRAALQLIGVSICLAAAAISAGGPIDSIALAAPLLAQRLARSAGINLGCTAPSGLHRSDWGRVTAGRRFCRAAAAGAVSNSCGVDHRGNGAALVFCLFWRVRGAGTEATV
ncbi:Ferric enterobactin transport system, permease component [Ketogulonicigenium robustum]|uniref:Ferric enterobactin transport system, permease component n=1 Tax=Ketogulonicigenium robustum TaxID=92947 RepID=A0A1W6NZ73_9RHOB|nr:Ferric enterobactin transport system, permease component [Ketogulonicigenium robustum]